MSITPSDLRELIIQPVLQSLEQHAGIPHSRVAEDLLMATCAIESGLGTHLHQVYGPALGIYQTELATLGDLLDNFILPSPRFAPALDIWSAPLTPRIQVVGNLYYATAICRLHYYRVKSALPASSDQRLLWDYYKPHYNSDLGAATFVGWQSAWKLTDISR